MTCINIILPGKDIIASILCYLDCLPRHASLCKLASRHTALLHVKSRRSDAILQKAAHGKGPHFHCAATSLS